MVVVLVVGAGVNRERDGAEVPLTRALSHPTSPPDMAQNAMLGHGQEIIIGEEGAHTSAGAAAEHRLRSTGTCDDDGSGWLWGFSVFSLFSLSLFFIMFNRAGLPAPTTYFGGKSLADLRFLLCHQSKRIRLGF